MNQKIVVFLFLCLGPLSEIKSQSYGLVVMGTNTVINVPEGSTYELVSATAPYGNIDYNPSSFSTASVVIEKSGKTTSFVAAPFNNDGRNRTPDPNSWVFSGDNSSFFVPGPAVIRYGANSQAGNPEITLNYKLLTATTSSSISSTSVVIPSSATGDVDVKLEQSADNVTWTECLPGTYNSSTVKRFFRLRAVEK
jgi:hypothetical protein